MKKIIVFSMTILVFIQCPNKETPKILGALALNTTNYVLITETNNTTTVSEGTDTDTYTLTPTGMPTANLVININFDATQLKINSSTTSPVQVTFTPNDWYTSQTVTVEALYDNITEGNHSQTITHSLSTLDSSFGTVLPSITVSITDTTSAKVKGSFQSGNVTLTAASQTINLAQTVDSTKSFVTCNAKLTSSNTDRAITCQLNTAGTQISIQSGGGLGAVVDWYVMEYATTATVQRGSSTFGVGSNLNNVTLTNISTSKTFAIVYTRSSAGANTDDGNRTTMATITSSTNLQLTRHETSNAATVEWQVIQFDGSNVQSGTVTIANGSTNNTAALGSAINTNSSFLIFNYKAATAIGGLEIDYYTRGSFSNSSTVSFTRRGTNQSVDISWFAVEMIDGTTVQSGSTNITGTVGGTNTNVTAALTTAVTTTKSMILFSNDTQTGDSGVATQDSGTYTATFNSALQINFQRNNDENNAASLDWFVVSFQ